MWLGLVYNLITIFSIWTHHVYRENANMMNFITITDVALVVLVGIMNLVNWFMAMSGYSTVEQSLSNYRVCLIFCKFIF